MRHNSIHDSYQRAVTIHATNYMTVEDNFAFNIFGHTIFVGEQVIPCFLCYIYSGKGRRKW